MMICFQFAANIDQLINFFEHLLKTLTDISLFNQYNFIVLYLGQINRKFIDNH